MASRPARSLPGRLLHARPFGLGPIWAWLLSLAVVCCLAAAIAGTVLYRSFTKDLPSIEWATRYRPPIVSEVVSGDEQLIGEFFDERRKVVPYERIPKKLVQAFLASEDAAFFDHAGVSYMGLLRGFLKTFVLRTRTTGGSTLSQQTAKAILISAEGRKAGAARKGLKAVRRKVRELVLTMRLEDRLSKEEILSLYLNEVYLGHHSYGVQAAAENYFRKNVAELTLPEMTLIAGLPQAPSDYSPFAHPEAARRRRAYVLRRMLEEGMIDASEHDAAEAQPVRVFPVADLSRETAPYVTEHVRRDLVARYGNDRLLRDGLRVYTTVDLEREVDATAATLRGVLETDRRQGFRGPLAHLPEKEWDGFIQKQAAHLAKEAAARTRLAAANGEPASTSSALEVVAALVTAVDPKEGAFAQVNVGTTKGRIPLSLARWARKPNSEVNAEHATIATLKGVLVPGDVVLVREWEGRDAAERASAAAKVRASGERLYALEQEPKIQGALVSMDPHSGYVRAMIGGYDFNKSEFNRAFQACRQPGSAFKPIVYSAAIELKGFTASTQLLDAPLVTDDLTTGKRWKPSNFEDTFEGAMAVRWALLHSRNTPAIRTLQSVGVHNAAVWAKKLGITSRINEDLSMALGSSCVYLWDLTNVYALFDRMGRRPKPIFTRRVLDRDGRVLEDHSSYYDPWTRLGDRLAAGYAELFSQPEQVIAPETAFLTTQLLTNVCKPPGTGGRASALGKPVAGKTGTTNDFFDAWFVGYTRDLVTGVWVGYDSYEQPMDKYETGGHAALPIWLEYMQRALKGVPQGSFEPPSDDIVWVSVDPRTGERTGGRPGGVLEAYLKGKQPGSGGEGGSEAAAATNAQDAVRAGGL